MSAITAKASRKMKKYAVLTREPRCFLGSFDFSWEQRKLGELALFNPKDELPQTFEYVDLESVVGTEMLSHRTEVKSSAPSRAQRLAHTGDLFYQTVRPYQKNNYLFEKPDNNYVFSTGYAQMRPYVDGYFLLSLVQSERFVKVVLDNCTGTSYPAINANDLAEIEVAAPSDESEAQKIGTIFRSIDNLITLHQRKCANLCSPSQVVFSLLFATSTFSWEQRKLGEMGQTYTGLSGKTKDDFGHGQARFVTYMNVFSNPISNPEMTEPIEIDPKQNEVEVGDVFFTTSSETPEEVGMSSILLEKRGKTYLNSFCFGFRPSEKIDSYYLAYMLRSESTRAKIILLAQGISRYNISKNKVMEIAVSLPSLDEQKMIGQYFSQLDNLITLHQRECISFTGRADRLILTANKKRTTSSWEQRKAIDIADYSKGNGYSKGDLTDAGTPIILYGRLYTKYQFAISEVDTFAFPRNGAVYSQGNEVIVPASGETAEDIARASAVEKSGVLLGGDLNILRPFDFINPLFLALAISNGEPQKELAKKAQGKSVVHIHNTDIQEVTIAYPSRTEQDRIVSVFRQLDNLITLHQRKPFLMKWRTSDANRNQTNRLVL